MNTDIFHKFRSYLQDAFKDAKYHIQNPDSVPHKDLYHIYAKDENHHIFVGSKGIKALADATNILAQDLQIGPYTSIEYLRREIEKALLLLVYSNQNELPKRSSEISYNLIDSLEKSQHFEWICAEPIVNLKIMISSFEIGRITFTDLNSNTFSDIFDMFVNKVKSASTPLDVKQFLISTLKENFRTETVALTKVESIDKTNAEQKSSYEIERALNVLRFYSFGISEHDILKGRMFFGRGGYTLRGQNVNLCLRKDQANFKIENKGYLLTFQLGDKEFLSMINLHFQKMSEILTKQNRSEFEELLLKAIEFFGSGVNEEEGKNTFVKFIMSLEIVLITGRGSKELLAERVALIMGERFEQRDQLLEIIKAMYDVRSQIVHGRLSIITLEDVNYLGSIAFGFLIKLIPLVGFIQSKNWLISLLNKMKLGNVQSFDELVRETHQS